jgi:hypothetical protein
MITLKPNLAQVAELPVLRDIFGREMRMKIQNRLVLGELPVKPPRRTVMQQKILTNEFHVKSIFGQKERQQSWQNITFFRPPRKHAMESKQIEPSLQFLGQPVEIHA